ncbi:MAG TPA: hypothetical protein VGN72_00210 [Tepidisphaeraceae bacterium]|jgi:hypothetical protein|nr:hypothetical protein [Tepidisphaeraceae bacterium]
MMGSDINLMQLDGLAQAMRTAPKVLLKELAKGYRDIGRYDIDTFRAGGVGKFKSKKVGNTFKFRASDPSKVETFDQLFVSEYTKWKAAPIFETGGQVRAKGKAMPILTEAGMKANGGRKYSANKIRQMLASGEVKIIPTPRGPIIIREVGGLTKTGKIRKGTRTEILAIFRKAINQVDRLDFTTHAQKNSGMHTQILQAAIDKALATIAAGGK